MSHTQTRSESSALTSQRFPFTICHFPARRLQVSMSGGRSRGFPRPLKPDSNSRKEDLSEGSRPGEFGGPLHRCRAEKSGPAGELMPNQSWPLPENVTILSPRFFVEFN